MRRERINFERKPGFFQRAKEGAVKAWRWATAEDLVQVHEKSRKANAERQLEQAEETAKTEIKTKIAEILLRQEVPSFPQAKQQIAVFDSLIEARDFDEKEERLAKLELRLNFKSLFSRNDLIRELSSEGQAYRAKVRKLLDLDRYTTQAAFEALKKLGK